MRITEMARQLNVTPRALRYYEDIGLITVDRTRGGVRLYGPEAREQLKLIVALRRANIPLDRVKDALDAGAQVHRDMLLERLATLDAERETLLESLSRLGGDAVSGSRPQAA
ncbi:MAG: MerR family transcriptional regulator [Janthinobacterium lividum]